MQIPLGTLYAGIWLNGLCIFLAAAFGLPLEPTILLTGIVVVAMTFVGGSWAAIAGDFIQVLILMPVTIVAAFLALHAVGGLDGFLTQLPASHLDVSMIFDSNLMLLWVFAIVVKQFISTNNLIDASRYLCVKDSSHARKAALLASTLFFIGPIIWFIPPMAASILHPDLGAMFPMLSNPSEAAFVAVCISTMPAGMIGLLLSGIFAATMSSMDSGLNRNAGIFVKNFYQPVVRPRANDVELMLAGRITTAVLGSLVILAALNFSRMKDLSLFDLMLQFGTLVAVPYTIPLVLGVLVKRTPPWSGWSTVAFCFIVSLVTTRFFGPDWAAATYDLPPFSPADRSYWTVTAGLFANVTFGTLWFFGTSLFWRSAPVADRARIEKFYTQMLTPVDYDKEIGGNTDFQQGHLLGRLCLAYGAFISALALIPNPLVGRLGFIFCGGVVALIGLALRRSAGPGAPRPPTPDQTPSRNSSAAP